ncbi:MAG: glycosyltransferase family 4 protein [Candidatus Hodarchaeota archaeon]
MRKINILHLRSSEGIFGAERVIMTFLNNTDPKTFRSFLACFNSRDNSGMHLINRVRRTKTFSLDTKLKFDFICLIRLREILTQYGIDIIHSHDFKSNFYAILSSIGKPIKRVTTIHGSIVNYRLMSLYTFFNDNLLYLFFHKLIAVSTPLYNEFHSRRLLSKKIELIQNGFDFSLYSPEDNAYNMEEKHQIPLDSIKVGLIGRLFYDKGHEYLLKALPQILGDYPKIKVLIIGEGDNEYKSYLTRLAKQLNVEDNVVFCGVINHMSSVYKALDIVVLPSLREGLPYVILEAMAFQKPIVATSVGDVPQLVKNKKTGILINPGNVEELSESIKYLIDNPDLSHTYGENARSLVLSKFAHHRMVSKIEELYKELTSAV